MQPEASSLALCSTLRTARTSGRSCGGVVTWLTVWQQVCMQTWRTQVTETQLSVIVCIRTDVCPLRDIIGSGVLAAGQLRGHAQGKSSLVLLLFSSPAPELASQIHSTCFTSCETGVIFARAPVNSATPAALPWVPASCGQHWPHTLYTARLLQYHRPYTTHISLNWPLALKNTDGRTQITVPELASKASVRCADCHGKLGGHIPGL